MVPASLGVSAQCTDNNTLTGTAITVPCPGTTTVPCVQGGQYALVNVTSGNIYTFSTCTSTAFDTQITLFNNAGGASLGYSDDACGTLGLQSSVQWTSTYNGQLRVLVDQYPCASNATCIPLTIQCAAPPPPVTNNDPCQAQVVSVTNTCVPSSWTNVGATLTTTPAIPAPGCGNLVAGSADVWFLFTAPPSGIVQIETGAGTLSDAAMALYTAAPNCSGTYTLVACDDDSGPGFMPMMNFNNLTPGQQYYLRVWGYGTNTGTFTLCIHGPTTVPTGNCVYVLQMNDSFGDGWDGSSVTITVNGSPYGTYTTTGPYNAVLIGLNIGQVLVVQYSATGSFQGENSYTLSFMGSGAQVFNSGSPPAAGVVYTATITCNPPPAPPEDCVGSITLCNSLGVSNNTNNTGNVSDLSTANAGCLFSNEVQGTWYNFGITTGGTVGFTIDPTAPDADAPDYDWAIWGPFPTNSTAGGICPPGASPIRCSYASGFDSWAATGSYNTGMGINNLAWANPQFASPATTYSDPAGGGDGWTPGLNVTAGQVYLMYVSNFSNTGQSFALNWQLGSGASLDCTVLPTQLLSLQATPIGAQVLLHWNTATEPALERFIVERSENGIDFEPVGERSAAGSAASGAAYELIDAAPLPGSSFYRVQQVSNNSTSLWSDVVPVFFNQDGNNSDLFPNPAGDLATWSVPSGLNIDHIVIFDAIGREARRFVQNKGSNSILLDLKGLPYGTLHVAAFDAAGAVVQRKDVVRY